MISLLTRKFYNLGSQVIFMVLYTETKSNTVFCICPCVHALCMYTKHIHNLHIYAFHMYMYAYEYYTIDHNWNIYPYMLLLFSSFFHLLKFSILFLDSMNLTLLESVFKWDHVVVSFCAWITLHDIMFSRFISTDFQVHLFCYKWF